MDGLNRPCLVCGTPTPNTRCDEHRATPKRKRASATRRGYDYRWAKLRNQAVAQQNWCTDCGTTDDLQGDHTPEAWNRKAKGLSIRLCDIIIRCGTCNRRAGAARGDNTTRTT